MKKFNSIILIILLTSPALYGAGTTAADFLNINLGARSTAMGDSFAGVGGDIYSIYHNPAGLTGINMMQGSFMHMSWLGQASYTSALFAYPQKEWTAGVMINYLGVRSVTGLDEYGFKTGDEHNPYDLMFTGSFAMIPLDRLSAGLNLKIINSKLTEDVSGSAFAADIGGQYELMEGDLNVGLALRNIGTRIELGSSHSLPFKVSAGGAYYVAKDILAAAEISMSKAKTEVSGGGEYRRDLGPVNSSLRLGYSSGDSQMGSIAGLRCGIGVEWNEFSFDYAWRPGGDLGHSHLFSLTYKFGQPLAVREEMPFEEFPSEEIGYRRTINSFVAGKVLDKDGNEIPDVTVRVDRGGEEVARLFTDRNGNYQSQPMEPGIYELKVWEKGYLYHTVEIEILETSPVRMDFTLTKELDQ